MGQHPRTVKRRALARTEIVDAARELVAAEGVAALTVDAVAARASMSKPAVYYYFRDKQAVLDEVVASIMEDECATCLAAVRNATSGADALVACLRAIVTFYADNAEAASVLFNHLHAAGVSGETASTRVNPRINEIIDAVAAKIDAERESGLVDPAVHSRRLATLARMFAMGIAWTWSLLPRVRSSSKHALDDLVAEAARTLEASLGTANRTAKPTAGRRVRQKK